MMELNQRSIFVGCLALLMTVVQARQAFASPGCTAFHGNNHGMAVTGSHSGAGGFDRGDTLIIDVLSPNIKAFIWDDTTSTRMATYSKGNFRFVIPATTSHTLMIEFELGEPFDGSASWSCSPAGSAPHGSAK